MGSYPCWSCRNHVRSPSGLQARTGCRAYESSCRLQTAKSKPGERSKVEVQTTSDVGARPPSHERAKAGVALVFCRHCALRRLIKVHGHLHSLQRLNTPNGLFVFGLGMKLVYPKSSFVAPTHCLSLSCASTHTRINSLHIPLKKRSRSCIVVRWIRSLLGVTFNNNDNIHSAVFVVEEPARPVGQKESCYAFCSFQDSTKPDPLVLCGIPHHR